MASEAPQATEAPATAEVQRIVLHERLDTAQAEALRAQLIEALDGASTLEVDSSKVQKVGTAALQLLLAAQREARQREVEWHWVETSPVIRDAATLLGLDESLALPPDPTPHAAG